MKIETNNIYNMCCLDGMDLMIDQGLKVDAIITSPPYDNLRNYNNSLSWNFEIFKKVANRLYQVINKGGVVVWIVGDKTKNGSETGTSFKQALYFMEIGFKLHDTMIYSKKNYIPLTHKRYEQKFEYMFIFVKGKIKTFNPIMIECKTAGIKRNRKKSNKEEGSSVRNRKEITTTKKYKQKSNVWEVSVSNTIYNHPAIFPLELIRDHIASWTNEGDVIFDTFIGSGTTAIACMNTNRRFIGFELDKGYYDIAIDRINKHVKKEGLT